MGDDREPARSGDFLGRGLGILGEISIRRPEIQSHQMSPAHRKFAS
jgi:hypothetical protein